MKESIFNKPEVPFEKPQEENAYLKEQLKSRVEKSPEEVGGSQIKEELEKYSQIPSDEIYTKEPQTEGITLNLKPEDHDDQMAGFLSMIEEKGIHTTLKAISKLGPPHTIDDFHRFLSEYLKEGYPIKGLKEKSLLSKELGHNLYEISLPKFTQEEGQKPISELISPMEQLVAGLSSVSGNNKKKVDQIFSFEIALSENSEQYIFYTSISKESGDLFEKQVMSIFPSARVDIKSDDFNIFNINGEVSGSTASLDKNPAYPIKTYEQFEYDPMNVTLNSFSKLKSKGDGVCIQFICNPVGDTYTSSFKSKIDKLNKGEKTREVLGKKSKLKTFIKVVEGTVGFFAGGNKETKKDESTKAPEIDHLAVDAVNKKIETPILEVNIRILASSETKLKADQIVKEVESTFKQFENPLGNKISFKTVFPKNINNFSRDFSFRTFSSKNALPLSYKELVSLFHFPTSISKVAPQVKESKTITAPTSIEFQKEGIVVGRNNHQGNSTDVHFSPSDRLRHFYVIGQTGTGKTTCLKNMIIQDIKNGEGVCMIDPHGSDVEEILGHIPPERYDDIIYFDPGYTEKSMSLNMLEYDPNFPEQKTFVVNEMLSIFNKLFDMKTAGGPMFEQYFRNATMLVIEDPESGNTLLDISRVLSDKAFREMKLSKCKNPLIIQFWKEIAGKAEGEAALENIVPYITSKFDVFLSNEIMRPIVSQEKSSFNFREIMDNKKILLVNLSKGKLGEINSSLLGLILVGKILMAALSRADSLGKDLPSFYLYIDEFQNITTDSISTIFSEARKYKLSLNVAHQFIAQLDEKIRDSVFGNVGSIAAFRVGTEDAEFLEKQFTPTFTANNIMNLDNHNAYVRMLSNGQPSDPFSMVNILHDREDKTELINKLKKFSYAKYGEDRNVLEEEIRRKYQK
ncbi:MAG: hypothetical protein ACI9GH_000343 [Candidatus Paceibacteria bacterium]|jgi:hypothetical protein